ncbi:MAG: potassium channel family protein [Pseudomonadota bacterium]
MIRKTLGIRPTSTVGSNARRAFSRVVGLSLCILLLENLLIAGKYPSLEPNAGHAVFAIASSLIYFGVICIWLLFVSKPHYSPNPIRLVSDILISGLFAIAAFSLAYRIWGIVDTLDATAAVASTDALYFSAVTFSTLGFGDFRPAESMRLVASFQALIGNLHLGLLAGAVFYALSIQNAKRDENGLNEKTHQKPKQADDTQDVR